MAPAVCLSRESSNSDRTLERRGLHLSTSLCGRSLLLHVYFSELWEEVWVDLVAFQRFIICEVRIILLKKR